MKNITNADEITTLSVRLPKNEKDRLNSFAQVRDLSMAQVVRKALKEYLDKQEG